MTKPSKPVSSSNGQPPAGEPWTEKDIYKMLANPIYVGLGPFPPIIKQEDFTAGLERLIREKGVKFFVDLLLDNLREMFGVTQDRDDDVAGIGYEMAIDDALKVLNTYLSAYPKSIFPEPPLDQHGASIDACSARALRSVLPNIIARVANLKEEAPEG